MNERDRAFMDLLIERAAARREDLEHRLRDEWEITLRGLPQGGFTAEAKRWHNAHNKAFQVIPDEQLMGGGSTAMGAIEDLLARIGGDGS